MRTLQDQNGEEYPREESVKNNIASRMLTRRGNRQKERWSEPAGIVGIDYSRRRYE